ncbi:MAG: hypothetical protein ACRDPQ_10610 [Nocardioidaceae bacterium]
MSGVVTCCRVEVGQLDRDRRRGWKKCLVPGTRDGHVANVGAHAKPATLHLETIWIKSLAITTDLVDTYSTPPR